VSRSRWLPPLLIFLVLAQGVALSAEATEPVPSTAIDALAGGEKLRALINAVVAEQRAISTMRADFAQTKRSELLLEPVTSRGTFLFRAPDSVRWDYVEPDAMSVLYVDGVLTSYHPDLHTAQRITTSRRQRRLLKVMSGTQPLDELTTHFAVSLADPGAPEPYRLTLTATDRLLKRKLTSLVLEIDRTLMLPVVVEYHEADGDSTRYEFTHIALNPPLDDAAFSLAFGPDVKVETVNASSAAGE
jgi:outer membrane lipoprotein-sorting protein